MFVRLLKQSLLAALLVVGITRCTPGFLPNDGIGDYRFLCIEGRNDWELCQNNRARYCHVTSDPHFHTRQNCEEQKLKCVETTNKTAACIDESTTCEENASKCENNTAYNCFNGNFGVRPCGTARVCEIKDGAAYCKSLQDESCGGHGELHEGKCECNTGYKVDPTDDRTCIAN